MSILRIKHADEWRVHVEPSQQAADFVWLFLMSGAFSGGTYLTPAEARELAAMLTAAAEQIEAAQKVAA